VVAFDGWYPLLPWLVGVGVLERDGLDGELAKIEGEREEAEDWTGEQQRGRKFDQGMRSTVWPRLGTRGYSEEHCSWKTRRMMDCFARRGLARNEVETLEWHGC
jgi:hypothetical protein